MKNLEKYTDEGVKLLMEYAPRLILAIVTLVIGFMIIRLISRLFNRVMDKQKMDVSLRPFLKSLVSILLKTLLVISVMGMVGIEMTSFIAVIGAAGLAIGMALQGSLQNFAGGVLILLLKPFKVGDFIAAQGHEGEVLEIRIFNTIMKTLDHKIVVIPNSPLATDVLVNYTPADKRRVDLAVGFSYNDNIDQARQVVEQVIQQDKRIIKEGAPEPNLIAVESLGDSSVNFTVRVWVNNANYWPVYFALTEKIKKAFDENGISIPFPQRDVHLYQV